jgi:trehalose-6-phosphatase
VVLIQVISSTSDSPELEAEVLKIAMRINSTYSTVTHQPLVLLKQDISHFQFVALLSVADVFMATNLCEGMNLTSHDFIHCQDGRFGSHLYGSLILSEFVGSASVFHERSGLSFKEHQLLVNPWNYNQCAISINAALGMSLEEKETEWKRLRSLKCPYTAVKWYRRLERDLVEIRRIQQLRKINDSSSLSLTDLKSSYLVARSRIFFLEDVATFGQGFPTDNSSLSKRALKTIELLLRNPKNVLYITSDQGTKQLKETLPKLPSDVGFLLENGCLIQLSKTEDCVQFVATSADNWRPGIRRMMKYFQKRTEGSRIMETPSSLVFCHDGAMDSEVTAHQVSELVDQINGARGSADFHIFRDTTLISVELPFSSQGKGVAARFALEHLSATQYPEFIFAAGSSHNDEALFQWANELRSTPTPSGFRTEFRKRLKVIHNFGNWHACHRGKIYLAG